ncbi:MAG: DUF3667 domain-containing protein [Saprospiraceae bacterium]|nr:DUF3667 domain-containing protein [Saprospiraceae bacterium]
MVEQDKQPKRITIKELFMYVLDVFNFEVGIPYAMKALLLHPKRSIDTYLSEDRHSIINPLRFAVVAITLSIIPLVSNPNNFMVPNLQEGSQQLEQSRKQFEFGESIGKRLKKKSNTDTEETPKTQQEKEAEFQEFISAQNEVFSVLRKYLNVFFFLSIPISALFTWLLYKGHKYNYAEHLVINCFLSGFAFMISFFLYLFDLWVKPGFPIGAILASVITIIYTVYLFKKIFEENWITTIGKYFLILVGQQIITTILIIIVAAGYLLIMH